MSDDRILIVDDEAEFSRVLAERLESRGLKTDTAESGPEALEKVRARSFDAVILDMMMPEMDGLETLAKMREENPDLQIILLTGHATLEKGVEAIKMGAADFLEKPADLESLLEKIKAAKVRKLLLMEKRGQSSIDDILGTKGW